MRYLFALILCLGLLGIPAGAQAPPVLLARRVQVSATDASLQQVLRDITRQSGVPFSYSSTFIPLQKRVTLHTPGRQPVGDVLRQLLQSRGVSYQVIGGQIVLWRTGEKPPFAAPAPVKAVAAAKSVPPTVAGSSTRNHSAGANTPGLTSNRSAAQKLARGQQAVAANGKVKPAAAVGYTRRATPAAKAIMARPATSAKPKPATASLLPSVTLPPALPPVPGATPAPSATADTAARETASALARLRQKARTAAQSATGALARTARQTGRVLGQGAQQVAGGAKAVLDTVALAATELREPLRKAAQLGIGKPGEPLVQRPVTVQSGLPGRDTVLAAVPVPPATVRKAYDRHVWQVSFVAPLGSNWLRSGRSINQFSLNILAGYAAGVRGVEVGGLVNVVRDTVRGGQAAGLLNVTGTEVQGVQAAGLVNVTGGSVRGAQAAGLVNLVRDDARGLQVAGLVNIVGGAARSRHNDGRPARARRALGLSRLLATDSVARHLGAPSAMSLPGPLLQAAGLANLTGTDIRGLQTAPLLNSARRVTGMQFGLINVGKHVKGVQLGLINIADSVDGVTLGIVNIVRHGYLHGEVWTSETLPLNAALKLGVRRYYTILAAATQPLNSRVHWATGFGLGTASRPHGRFSWNLDVLGWYLIKQSGTEGTLLSYNQLRPSLVWQIEPQGHLGLVFSPTLNLALYENDGNGTNSEFGKNQLLLTDTQWGNTPVRMWIGGQIGLRF
ncbi:STN domain-containing protein [Hymenobacter chitinivorans]|uniref:Secretin/TonB short N-terminal domain-containing protein n=1 Tax=Hymenobacter chitinivorans DSM 11115 TaxID=1121954 RepID=A0A2M9ASX6_9BACT|nr:STN domain-containing protein [Hymenobacter chitinivorans]PJJ48782.1 hypothetical protein CLV45_4492 [Hymenobacter chitinivorans DSM 11115]